MSYCEEKETKEISAFSVNAINTNGSGDVFHGVFASAVVQGDSFEKAAIFASAVSVIRCTRLDSGKVAPGYEETVSFLKNQKMI